LKVVSVHVSVGEIEKLIVIHCLSYFFWGYFYFGWLLVFLLKKLELEESLCKQYKQAKERVLFSYICPMSKIYL